MLKEQRDLWKNNYDAQLDSFGNRLSQRTEEQKKTKCIGGVQRYTVFADQCFVNSFPSINSADETKTLKTFVWF